MYDLQIFFQRRRKMLTRVGALLVLGLAGTFAVLPRADAHGTVVKQADAKAFLLSPHSISGRHFAAFYPLPHS
jgi:hypothetical protein